MSDNNEWKQAYFEMNKKYTQAVAQEKLFKAILVTSIERVLDVAKRYDALLGSTATGTSELIFKHLEKNCIGTPKQREDVKKLIAGSKPMAVSSSELERARGYQKALQEELSKITTSRPS